MALNAGGEKEKLTNAMSIYIVPSILKMGRE